MTSPNVLFIIMDDQRADMLFGDTAHCPPVPELRGLIQRGTSFRNTFVTTPICTPGRAEVLTGCHTFHNEVPWFCCPIKDDLPLLPRHFHAHGYHTIFSGKWHNDGHPTDRGFDRVRRVFESDNLNQGEYAHHGHTMRFAEPDGEVTGHSTDLFTKAASEEIAQAPKDRPWFCYLGYHSPHDPFDCPEPFGSMFGPDEVPLPPDYAPEPRHDNGELTIRDELLLPWPRTQEAVREYRARYWQMMAHHDNRIGQLLRQLEDSGELANTIVVFTSDHGLAVGSHGLLGKENMYDHSCRIPWVMAGPRIPEGSSIHELTANTDIFPTLCELCHIDQPVGIDGRSHAKMIGGEEDSSRDFVVCAFQSPAPGSNPRATDDLRATQRAIRTEDWKLVFYPLSGRYELYALKDDPLEMKNLLEPWRLYPDARWGFHPEQAPEDVLSLASTLRERLLNWQQENGDPAVTAVRKAGITRLQ